MSIRIEIIADTVPELDRMLGQLRVGLNVCAATALVLEPRDGQTVEQAIAEATPDIDIDIDQAEPAEPAKRVRVRASRAKPPIALEPEAEPEPEADPELGETEPETALDETEDETESEDPFAEDEAANEIEAVLAKMTNAKAHEMGLHFLRQAYATPYGSGLVKKLQAKWRVARFSEVPEAKGKDLYRDAKLVADEVQAQSAQDAKSEAEIKAKTALAAKAKSKGK